MHRRRTAATLAGAAVLAALTAPAAVAATPAPTGPPGPFTTCGTPGAPGFLTTRACIEVNGLQVRLFGQAYPTDPAWVPQNVGFKLSGTAPGLPPGPALYTTVLVPAGGTSVGEILTTATCGSSVTANFSVDNGGWPPSTATVTVTVPC
ncbi:hypothetical protein GCM10009639_57420 [Kitasatospora putterlickiae]|uniref:Uncharacterized protein n=1 Tax=Kitasatospora putterlickiae TaxID=221725 RepID=A0ABN1YF92_9ACTN